MSEPGARGGPHDRCWLVAIGLGPRLSWHKRGLLLKEALFRRRPPHPQRRGESIAHMTDQPAPGSVC